MAEVIGGYRLQHLMMTGQTSQVWEVVEESSQRRYAMKLLLPENATNSEYRRMLFHEASAAQAMAHQNVIRIITTNKESKTPYFVMEFFPGGSLKRLLARIGFTPGYVRSEHGDHPAEYVEEKITDVHKLTFLREHALSLFQQAASALAFVHDQGWVHRDVKPDNMLVNSAGELRVIDFRLAQPIERPSVFGNLFRKRAEMRGTRNYVSPEEIRGNPLDGRADIYSFGCSCYELTALQPPFRGASPHDVLVKHVTEKPANPRCLRSRIYNTDITPEFADLTLRMLNKKREDRPRDFREVLLALQTIQVFKDVETKTRSKVW